MGELIIKTTNGESYHYNIGTINGELYHHSTRTINGELYHHGILGMHWGVRRYQNSDGSLTKAGKKRYLKSEEALDKESHKRAKKDNLDDGDNYKIYKRSIAGDEEASKIIEQWKTANKEKEMFKPDKYGDYSFTTKNGIRVNLEDQNLFHEGAEIVRALNKENLSKMEHEIAKMAARDSWNEEHIPVENIAKNLRMYNCRVVDKHGDNIGLDISFEHKDLFDDSAIFTDHSIDFDGAYNTKTKQFKLGNYSING